MAFGLTPALRGGASAAALVAVRAGRRRPRIHGLQRALVIGQLAVLARAAGLAGILLRGLSAAWRTDVGFTYDDRVVGRDRPPPAEL